ncbi:MAG: hypothetical protein ABF334_05005 [Akkermansiaceae bacterium]
MSREIIPFTGFVGAQFGQLRSKVRQTLGSGFSSFKKTPFSETETDAYDNLGIHLFYNKDDRLEFIEAFPPAQVHFKGIEFINQNIDAVIGEMKQFCSDYRFEEPSYFFDDYGLVLNEEDGKIEGVSLFSKGYYE